MKINSRHYVLIMISLLCVIIVSYGYYYIYNMAIIQAGNHQNIVSEIKNEDSRSLNTQNLLKVYNATKESRDKLSSYFVNKDKIVNFIEMVEGVGDNSNTELELSSISNDENIIRAKIQVKGSWSGVMTALIMIENLPLSMSINNVRLDSSGDLSKNHGWNMNLDIEGLINK